MTCQSHCPPNISLFEGDTYLITLTSGKVCIDWNLHSVVTAGRRISSQLCHSKCRWKGQSSGGIAIDVMTLFRWLIVRHGTVGSPPNCVGMYRYGLFVGMSLLQWKTKVEDSFHKAAVEISGVAKVSWSDTVITTTKTNSDKLVSWYFQPSQPQRIISGLKTNLNLSLTYSAQKSPNHKFSQIYKISPGTICMEQNIHTQTTNTKFSKN